MPLPRQQGSGYILGVSSGLGIVSMPLISFYCATKWAIEALHESLAHEVKDFGIKVTLIEPGAYATDFGKSAKRADGTEAYGPLRQRIFERLASMERGNPHATADAVLKMVDAKEPPLRMILGNKSLSEARAAYADRLWPPGRLGKRSRTQRKANRRLARQGRH
jgi:short-subunit dehydrogenase